MAKHYIYQMDIVDNSIYQGSYIGQHKIGKKPPESDGYKGSGCKWKRTILANHIPVKKTVIRICDSIEEANYWEQYYVEQATKLGLVLWNVAKGGGGHDFDKIYTEEEIKAHNKERLQRWCESNQDHVKEYRKQYLERNKEHITSVKREYVSKNKDYFTNYYKQYYKDNKELLSQKNKQYYKQHKEETKEHRKEYYKSYIETHREQKRLSSKKYHEEHKEERELYYSRPCLYDEKILTFRAVILRLRRQNVPNPTETAKQYLINGGV